MNPMKGRRIIKQAEIRKIITLITVISIGIALTTVAAFGHGGKHANAFTHLQALQKATQLYDKLISNKKLDPSWETTLKQVTVSNRQKGDKKETVVEFHRSEGDPPAVYIFFNAAGKYTGSNFTGE
jgi:hypothetical protein